MDTGEVLIESIPFTAWEQAVFVALFIVFVVGLLLWFGKQSDKWQKFMFDIDEKWRAFSREQREENNCAMAEVESGLSDLTTVTQGLVHEIREMREDSKSFYTDFHNHDIQTKEVLGYVKRVKDAVTKPRISKEIKKESGLRGETPRKE